MSHYPPPPQPPESIPDQNTVDQNDDSILAMALNDSIFSLEKIILPLYHASSLPQSRFTTPYLESNFILKSRLICLS